MDKKIYDLFKDVTSDFEEYHFLPNDLYKGKLIGGFNVYFKKGNDSKEGMITGKNNIKRFNLEQFPYNFVSMNGYGQNAREEKGWTEDNLVQVLNHIKRIIKNEN